jgi:lipopolysaccharide transport system ATP-binding protein
MSSDVLIRAENIGKKYIAYSRPYHRLLQFLPGVSELRGKEFWALRGINLELDRGDTMALIGTNGSGKSTLLQLICGTLSATEGTIAVNGRVSALLELGAGFNPQFTGRENVYLNATVLGLPRSEINARFDDIAAFAEIGDFIDQPVRTYSSGMFVRLAFAVAVQVDPDLLVVDEALAVGDARFQTKCMARIRQMQDRGTAVLFVSHDMSAVRKLCSRALWLHKGVQRGAGDVAPISAEYMRSLQEDAADRGNAESFPSNSNATGYAGARNGLPGAPPVTWPKAINHWGDEIGCIIALQLQLDQRVDTTVADVGELIIVRITARAPSTAVNRTTVAFSLKNVEGLDLVCFSSDEHDLGLEPGEIGTFSFEFPVVLNAGTYMLAPSIEDRSSGFIRYWEYIEGAEFLKVNSSRLRYGLVVPPMNLKLEKATKGV